jgi:hypothetical protein
MMLSRKCRELLSRGESDTLGSSLVLIHPSIHAHSTLQVFAGQKGLKSIIQTNQSTKCPKQQLKPSWLFGTE